MCELSAFGLGLLVVSLAGRNACAEETLPASLRGIASVTPGRLVGSWSPGGQAGEGPRGGPFLGVEGAWATTLPVADDPSHGSLAFGMRAGWAFANGLAFQVRYDDLGVEPSSSRSPLQAATGGLRYSLPFVVPLPFAEVDAGPAFVGGDVHLGAAAGLGASVPLGPYVLIDLVARDWLVPIAGELRQTLTAGLGLTVTFASPGR
jgi:hypothetical protein